MLDGDAKHRNTVAPLSMLFLGVAQIALRVIEFVDRGDALVTFISKLPVWIRWAGHPLVGFAALVIGFAWIAFLSKEQQHQPSTRLVDADGKPYEARRITLGRVCVVTIIGIAVAAGIWWILPRGHRSNMANDQRYQVGEGAKIEIVSVEPLPSEGDRLIRLKVTFRNTGLLPALDFQRVSPWKISDKILSAAELDEGFKAAVLPPLAVMDKDKNEIQPGENSFFISTSSIVGSDVAGKIWAGQKLLYLTVAFAYRDRKLTSGQKLVTEFCGYWSGQMDFYVVCDGHNRIYVRNQ